jgi:replication factor C subunit 1
MPSDIRSFFGPKGGGSAPKPAPRKAEELAKSKRTSRLISARIQLIDVLIEVQKEEKLSKTARTTRMK